MCGSVKWLNGGFDPVSVLKDDLKFITDTESGLKSMLLCDRQSSQLCHVGVCTAACDGAR